MTTTTNVPENFEPVRPRATFLLWLVKPPSTLGRLVFALHPLRLTALHEAAGAPFVVDAVRTPEQRG